MHSTASITTATFTAASITTIALAAAFATTLATTTLATASLTTTTFAAPSVASSLTATALATALTITFSTTDIGRRRGRCRRGGREVELGGGRIGGILQGDGHAVVHLRAARPPILAPAKHKVPSSCAIVLNWRDGAVCIDHELVTATNGEGIGTGVAQADHLCSRAVFTHPVTAVDMQAGAAICSARYCRMAWQIDVALRPKLQRAGSSDTRRGTEV